MTSSAWAGAFLLLLGGVLAVFVLAGIEWILARVRQRRDDQDTFGDQGA